MADMAAQAQVWEVRDTGALTDDDPVAELDLLVAPEGSRHRVPVTVRRQVPRVSVGSIVPGAIIPARYDPTDPDGIVLDFAATTRADTR